MDHCADLKFYVLTFFINLVPAQLAREVSYLAYLAYLRLPGTGPFPGFNPHGMVGMTKY